MTLIDNRIADLRSFMHDHEISAFIITSSDPHRSEYVPDNWKIREWISGFTGSAGTVVITQNHAGLWADSRYFIQAETELADSEVTLHKVFNQGSPDFIHWLSNNLVAGSVVGMEAKQASRAEAKSYSRQLAAHDIRFDLSTSFLNEVWKDRPSKPNKSVYDHNLKFAGEARIEKIARVRNHMTDKKLSHYLVSALDDVAWLLNLRGADVDCNPVFIAFCLLDQKNTTLYIDIEKVDESLKNTLADEGIELKPYIALESDLEQLKESDHIWIDPSTMNMRLYQLLPDLMVTEKESKVKHLKAIKNETEISYFRKVMIKDAVALAETFYWLEQSIKERPVKESEVAQALIKNRSAKDHYVGESFDAIVGYKGNGAIVHYRAQEDTCASIENNGMLLVDSGGQYLDGTTDITRTFCFSEPTDEQKKTYTQVLKGHIELAQAIFPAGTRGIQLDTLARRHLWADKLNYLHGTGHGVGFFLNVHEPPNGFANNLSERGKSVMKEGMVTSNEPGYYKENEFGIRIENLVLCKKLGTSEYGDFLHFETITMYPMEIKLIDASILNEDEIKWINDYQKEVWEKVGPFIKDELKGWFEMKCGSLT